VLLLDIAEFELKCAEASEPEPGQNLSKKNVEKLFEEKYCESLLCELELADL